MNRVILESPFRAKTFLERYYNKQYLQECIRDSLSRNEAPFASHQMYTDALRDENARERADGIHAGYAWWDAGEKIVFYVDRGWSKGMKWARVRAEAAGRVTEERKIR